MESKDDGSAFCAVLADAQTNMRNIKILES